MKITHVFISVIMLLVISGCTRYKDNFFQERNKNKIIALQPLGNYDLVQLTFISKELSNYYKRQVVILNPVPIPLTFRLAPNAELYSADSILNMLSGLLNTEIIKVVGVTSKNIYIKKESSDKTINELSGNSVSPVFGFGDYPGNCSVVSDYLFKTSATTIFQRRLRTVIIHELGHNLGLDHCIFNKCIMSGENGNIPILDKSGNDYCHRCKRKLNQ